MNNNKDTISKVKALAKYLDCDIDDLNSSNIGGVEENRFELGNQEYLVLTDSEADEMAKEYILDILWAFNAGFILSHSDVEMDEKDLTAIQKKKCEDANGFVKSLIKDLDYFIEDAINCDGRGHFLSSYDGAENEQDNYFIYRTN